MRYVLILIILILCLPVHSAEFLIYNKDHWMDKLSSKELEVYIKNYPNFQEKYDARYQWGDVIEVRPDGFWTGPKARGFNRKAFRVVAVPGFQEKTAMQYMASSSTRRRRYSTVTGGGKWIEVKANISEVVINDKELVSAEKQKLHFISRVLLIFNLAS